MSSSRSASTLAALLVLGAASASAPTRGPTLTPTLTPSLAPTRTPTLTPTLAPSQFPTQPGGGWATVSYWNADDLVMMSGRKTGVCFPFYADGSVSFRFTVMCGDEAIELRKYEPEDSDCTGSFERQDQTDFSPEYSHIGNTQMSDVTGITLQCTADSDPFTFASDLSGEYFSTELFYPSTDVCTSTSSAIVFVSYLENFCYNYEVTHVSTEAPHDTVTFARSAMYESAASPSQDISFARFATLNCEVRENYNTTLPLNDCADTNSDWNEEAAAASFHLSAGAKTPLDMAVYRAFHPKEGKAAAAPADPLKLSAPLTSFLAKRGVSPADLTPSPKAKASRLASLLTKLGVAPTSAVNAKASAAKANAVNKEAAQRAFASVAKKVGAKVESADNIDLQQSFTSYGYTYSSSEYVDDILAGLGSLDGASEATYSQWIHYPAYPSPTQAPSVAPTQPSARPTPVAGAPTAAPTVAEPYKFSGSLTLKGTNQQKWYANSDNSLSFRQAAAATMNSMDPAWITITSVTNIHPENSDSRKLRQLDSDNVRKVTVNFDVAFNLAWVGYDTIDDAYTALTEALYDGVVITGIFDGYLHSYGTTNDASLSKASSMDVQFTEAEAVTEPKKHPASTHAALITGLVVGVGVGLMCIAFMAGYVFFLEK